MKKFILFAILFLFPALAEATTWHVAKATDGGSAANTCTQAQSVSTPKLTIDQGLACLVASGTAGDSLAIRRGTYDEVIDSATRLIPNGTSFANPVRIYAYDGTDSVILTGGIGLQVGRQFIIVDGLILDGSNISNADSLVFFAGNNLRAINVTARNTGLNFPSNDVVGAGFFNFGNNNEYLNCKMLNNGSRVNVVGTSANYGMYMGGTGNVVDNCTVSGNGGYGIHMYSSSGGVNNNTVKNSRIFHNGYGTEGSAHLGAGLLISSGSGNIALNNVIYDNNIGIQLSTTPQCVSCLVYGNTVYGNKLGIVANVTPTIRNNIFSANTPDGNMLLEGSTASVSNNLCGPSACPYGTSNVTESATATFNDVVNRVFTLKPTSAAINAGFPLGAPYNVDIVNTSRPQPPGGAYDIGAYESGVTPPVTTCPGVSPALVASYAFEDSSNDSTGTHTATLGSGWTYMAGKYGRGIVSTGASGITVADNDQIDMCGGFTYMGWINLPNTTGDYAFIVKNPDSKSFLFGSITAGCGAGRPLAGYSQDPVSVAACYATALTTGSFQHLAVTYDSSLPSANVKLYINGSLATSADGTTLLDATTGTLQFCTSSFNETCPSGTVIDEVKIYNYARTAQQIVNDMDSAIQVGVPTELIISGGTRRIGPGTTLRYGLKK
jgi:parallel beta-helix repeat protein